MGVPFCWVARLFGAESLFVDSFARTAGVSLSARLVRPVARVWVQWPESHARRPWTEHQGSVYTIRSEGGPIPGGAKETPRRPRVFVVLGMGHHHFPRLAAAALELADSCDLVIQSGSTPISIPSEHAENVRALSFIEYDEVLAELREADAVIAHGGTGSIITALSAGHRPIVVARRAELGEHVDDHQGATVSALEGIGVIDVADDADSLRKRVSAAVRTRTQVTAGPLVDALMAHLFPAMTPGANGARLARRPVSE